MIDHSHPPHLTVVDHPLVQHKLTHMRKVGTPTGVFRQLLREISQLLAYEITRNLEMTKETIETPLCPMEAPVLDGKKLALISILRAGNGLLDGVHAVVVIGDVGAVDDGLAAGSGDLVDDGLRSVGVDVVDDDGAAFAGKDTGVGCAQSAAGAGDEPVGCTLPAFGPADEVVAMG